MIPVHAVGGAAGAVGGLADSGVVVGMTRGRLWIGVLGLLLGGIVALNVWGLSMSASTTGVAAKIDELERRNSVLAATAAKRQSSDRVQKAADEIGLVTPTPKAITHLKARSADARRAAERLAAGEIGALDGLVAPELAAVAGAAAATEAPPAEGTAPVAEAVPPAAPVTPEPTAEPPTPVEPAPVAPEPVAPTPTSPPGGGVAP